MNEIATKIYIPPTAKVRVKWEDRPENYSKENKNLIKNKNITINYIIQYLCDSTTVIIFNG